MVDQKEKSSAGALPQGAFVRWLAPLAFVVCLFVLPAHGQQASTTPPAPGAQDAGVAPTVDEVTLDMVIHDKKQRQIQDLKPEDFVISDNDTPVKLSGFHLVNGDSTSDHLVTMVFDHFEGATAKSTLNTADKILKMLPAKGYTFAVLDYAGRLRLIQAFTDDRREVQQAVTVATASQVMRLQSTNTLAVNIATDKAEAGRAKAAAEVEKNLISIVRTGADLSGKNVDVKERARCQTLLAALQDSQKIMQDQHAQPTLAGLLALVRSQQRISARKSLIYFTQSSQMDTAAKEMIKTITGAGARSGVTIYAVDMDALDVGGRHQLDTAMLSGGAPFDPVPQAVAGSGGMATITPTRQQGGMGFGQNPLGSSADFMMRTEDSNPFATVKSPMADLAKDTGGTYIDAQNSLKKPLEQMLHDMTTYYEATYVPPIQDYDGSFRTIAAKPVRAGLTIKTKTGYFALPPGADGEVRPFEAPLLKILAQAQLPTDLIFHPAVLQFGELPDGNTSTLAVEIPISQLQVNKDVHTNLYAAHVSVVAEIKDSKGTVIEHYGEDISRRGALESVDNDKSAAITLQRHFIAIPGRYTMEVAVLDQLGQKASAQRIPFEIPSTQTNPSLSRLVLVSKVDTIHEGDDPLEPMRYEQGKITPNLSGVVPERAKTVSLFFILHTDPNSKSPATLEVEASLNGRSGRLTPLPLHLQNADAAVPYLASFNSSSLAPGSYEVKAMLTQDGKTAVQNVEFTVPGTPMASGAGAANAAAPGHGGAPADAGVTLSDANDAFAGTLAITATTNPVPPPAPDEVKTLIEDARGRAVSYAESLPNFMCIEVTDRSYDTTATGRWKHRDTLTELLRYHEKTETHTMLEIDGKASNVDRGALLNQKKSTLSGGELGGVLKAVFDPSAKADMQWKETDALGSGTVQVFNYRVAKSNSMFSVVGMNNMQIIVGFHGQVFIDAATRNVRRVSLEADDLPADFPTHSTDMVVDYDYVAINGHDYLMPVSAAVRLTQGRHEAVMNTMEFRDYKRYGSNMKILGFTPLDKQP